jgi:hypothetical protein
MKAQYSVLAFAAARNRLIGGNLSKVSLILSASGGRVEGISSVVKCSWLLFVGTVVRGARGNVIKSKRHGN